jgi:hypothetical protein
MGGLRAGQEIRALFQTFDFQFCFLGGVGHADTLA